MISPDRYVSLAARLDEQVEADRDKAIALSDDIADHPEIGGQEIESSRKMVRFLREGGFEVEYPFMGIDTAFIGKKGKAGKGGRVALLAEYDALPVMGHACGHNLHGTMSLLAGLALEPLIDELDCELWVVGTPAEENDGAKVKMAEKGAFDGLDLALMIHSWGGETFVPCESLAMDAIEFTFHGKAAHAAGMPWEGKNALNGVQLLFHSVDMLRQHVKPEVRMHGIVTSGGVAPNIVPETAKAFFYFRAPRRNDLNRIVEQVTNCARGAALATGTKVEWENIEISFNDMLPNPSGEAAMTDVFRELGVPLVPSPGVMGSSDVGDVSYRCPALQPQMDVTGGEHIAVHTREFARAVKADAAHKALATGAKALGRMALKTFLDPELQRRMKEEQIRESRC